MKNRTFKVHQVLCLFFVLSAGLASVGTEVLAEEAPVELPPLVVTATRGEVPLYETAASVTLIDGKTLEEKHLKTVLEALRQVSGLDVVQTGGPGGTTSVFLRGSNSNHTLVLIDGVQVNSPTLGQYNFANLTTENIDRIEIIRGPQSTLYGSDAIGGVIQIFTKKGQGPFSGSVSLEGGSFESSREVAQLQGASGLTDYSLTVSRFDNKGFSKANEDAGNSEEDGYENTSLSLRTGLNLGDDARLDWTLRYSQAKVDLDNSFPVSDDLNATQEDEALSTALSFKSAFSGVWKQKLQLLFQQEKSQGKDPDTFFNNFEVDTRRHQIDWQHNITLGEFNLMTVGYEYEVQQGENKGTFDESITNNAAYALNQFQHEAFTLNLGLRRDDNQRFGDKTTYKTEAAYLFEETNSKLRASYGSGFHAPTLNDLFFPGFGNTNLKPEESESYEIGLEKKLMGDAIHLNTSFFYTEIEQLIVFVVKDFTNFTGTAENVEKARIKGWEAGLDVRLSDALSLSGNYTRTDSRNLSNNKALARRPRHKASGSITLKPSDALNVILDILYVGRRFDDTSNNTEMPGYTLLHLSGTYQMGENVEVFSRIENLLDKEYEAVSGFGTAGLSAYGGVKLRF